ncbi:unnamed protein product [Camellia sinensis]
MYPNNEPSSSLFFAIRYAKGLFCLFEQDRFYLWNPSIRKSMAMPKPTIKTSMHYHGFGFDPRGNDYKVVTIANRTKLPNGEPITHIEVNSLNAGVWKMSSMGRNSYPDGITIGYSGRFAAYLEGAVHFAANMKKSNDPLILSFDLCDEVFQTMMLPDGIVGQRAEVRASVFGGLLSLLCYEDSAVYKSCSIWIMKKYGVVDSLYKQFTIDLSRGITQVLGIQNNGHILLETKAPSDWVLSSYDPSSQQTKNWGIYATSNHFVVDTYEENLILLNKPNDAFSRRRVSRKRKDRGTSHLKRHANKHLQGRQPDIRSQMQLGVSSTVASEIAFSAGGRVFSDYRSKLSSEMVEALIISRDHMHALTRRQNYSEKKQIQNDLDDIFSGNAIEMLTLDRGFQARIKALNSDIQRQTNEVELQLKEIKGKVEEAMEVIARMGPPQHAEVYANSRLFFCKCDPLLFQAMFMIMVEQIDSTRLTATFQSCEVAAEKLSHSRVLGRGVGVKGKDLNGCTGQGLYER